MATKEQDILTLDDALILVVDDNPELLFTTQALLESHGAKVIAGENGEEAIALAAEKQPSLILMDVVMPKKSGLDAAKDLKASEETRSIPIILMSSRDELEDISAGIQSGADDYIRKPFDPKELIARVQSGLHLGALYREVVQLRNEKSELEQNDPFFDAVGDSAAFRDVVGKVLRFKDSSAPVLIQGESGTGKEKVALAVHRSSSRGGRPFIAQNCGALHENLLESELFGFVKGAFTGADRDSKGLFESADLGTLFLDEVGEMSLSLQAKLLRVLQEGVVTPVGSNSERKVDVRIVTATHRNLESMVKEGTFREDLLFRLKVLELELPPLRDRIEDLPLLADHFLDESCNRQRKPRKFLAEETLLFLSRYDWPGNIRELQNEIERIVSLSGMATQLGPAYLGAHFWKQSADERASSESKDGGVKELPEWLFDVPLREALADVESQLIDSALKKAKGNKSEAARTLGISRSNLITKVQSYRLDDE